MVSLRVVARDGVTLIEARGHASPVVCAAISAITQTAMLGLLALAMTNPGIKVVEVDMPKDTVRMYPPEPTDEPTQAVRPEGTK